MCAGLAVLALAAFGISQLSSSEPQSRVYVAGSSSEPVFGYRSCGQASISSLTVYAVRGDHSELVWSIRSRTPGGSRVLRVRLGETPAGFVEIHSLPAVHDWTRLRFRIETTSGGGDGRAFDLSEIRDGYVLWSDGYAAGDNLDAIPASRFGC